MVSTVEKLRPDDVTRAAIVRLADQIEREDGAPPLSDQARSLLTSSNVDHLTVRDGDEVVGYGQLERSGTGPAAAEILTRTAPAAGLILDAIGTGPLLIWSHGRRSRLVEVFTAAGFERTRDLHQLRRPATPLPADPPLAEGVTVRAFVPGVDDSAWLAVNAAAFAHHAEQGRMTQADLDARIAEAWFDPAGFLLAEREGELLGFHWTKVHTDGLGEVYVLGVAPTAQGLGLGSALLVRGLRHLGEQNCPQILLYVDGDNPGALHLYERDGFTRYDLDTQWRWPAR